VKRGRKVGYKATQEEKEKKRIASMGNKSASKKKAKDFVNSVDRRVK
jgi:hypothetical protein